MNKLKYIWIVAAMIVALSACTISYKLNGAAIDYSIYKTINVGQFPIRAAMVYAPLQPMFENKLTDTYTKQITGYSLTPQAVTEDAYASKTRLTISVRVKYTDHKQPKNSIDQSFSAFRDFDSSEMLTNVQDQLCEEITEELVMLIFNATAGNW